MLTNTEVSITTLRGIGDTMYTRSIPRRKLIVITCIHPDKLKFLYHTPCTCAGNMCPVMWCSRMPFAHAQCATSVSVIANTDRLYTVVEFLVRWGTMYPFTTDSMRRSPHIPPWLAKPMVTRRLVKVPSRKDRNPEIRTSPTVVSNAA